MAEVAVAEEAMVMQAEVKGEEEVVDPLLVLQVRRLKECALT